MKSNISGWLVSRYSRESLQSIYVAGVSLGEPLNPGLSLNNRKGGLVLNGQGLSLKVGLVNAMVAPTPIFWKTVPLTNLD